MSVDRQAGKTLLILALAVWLMLRRPGTLLTWTTASGLAGRRKMLRCGRRYRGVAAAGHVPGHKGTGTESLECRNDSALFLLSGDEASAVTAIRPTARSWTSAGR